MTGQENRWITGRISGRCDAQRAMAARPDFVITSENAPAVAEICRRLDGLPLAIELAAARLKFFTPQTLLARLSGRLDLLKTSTANVHARHQTLRQCDRMEL